MGANHPYKKQIEDTLQLRIKELGVSASAIDIIDQSNFSSNYIGNAPTVGLYFGSTNITFPNQAMLDVILTGANIVIPIVDSLENFKSQTPRVYDKLHFLKRKQYICETNIYSIWTKQQ